MIAGRKVNTMSKQRSNSPLRARTFVALVGDVEREMRHQGRIIRRIVTRASEEANLRYDPTGCDLTRLDKAVKLSHCTPVLGAKEIMSMASTRHMRGGNYQPKVLRQAKRS
jgi:hypothetical protein